MDNPSIRALLHRIGLDEREADVYLAALMLRSARASEIAKAAKQSRSHTYLMLRSLERRGLVSEVERGKVLSFVAAEPDRLLTYLKDRQRELQSLEKLTEGALPQLKSLTGPMLQEPRVTLLHGIDGMKQVYHEIFPNAFCALFNPESMYRAFGTGIPQMILNQDESLKGKDLLVDNTAAKRFIKENPQNDDYTIRLLPEKITFETDTMVYGDTMALFSYDTDHTIIRIENRNIADSFRSWFEILWNQSTNVTR